MVLTALHLDDYSRTSVLLCSFIQLFCLEGLREFVSSSFGIGSCSGRALCIRGE